MKVRAPRDSAAFSNLRGTPKLSAAGCGHVPVLYYYDLSVGIIMTLVSDRQR
jgi:hypothetical protein